MNRKNTIKRFNRQLKRGNLKAVKVDDMRKARVERDIKAFQKRGLKSASARAILKHEKIAFQKFTRTNEAKSINQPVSRYTAKVKKEYRGGYVLNEYHQMIEKPKEWIRLNHRDLNAVKVLSKQKYI